MMSQYPLHVEASLDKGVGITRNKRLHVAYYAGLAVCLVIINKILKQSILVTPKQFHNTWKKNYEWAYMMWNGNTISTVYSSIVLATFQLYKPEYISLWPDVKALKLLLFYTISCNVHVLIQTWAFSKIWVESFIETWKELRNFHRFYSLIPNNKALASLIQTCPIIIGFVTWDLAESTKFIVLRWLIFYHFGTHICNPL